MCGDEPILCGGLPIICGLMGMPWCMGILCIPTPGGTCPAVLPASAAAASQGARAYADSRKQAMERAALIREQRRAEATGSGERGGDALDAFCARSGSRAGRAAGTGVVGAGPVGGTAAQSELDLLHAAGDAKFGRPRRRV